MYEEVFWVWGFSFLRVFFWFYVGFCFVFVYFKFDFIIDSFIKWMEIDYIEEKEDWLKRKMNKVVEV